MVNDSVCDRAKRTVTAIELVACHAFRHIAHILSLNMHTYTQAIQIFEAKADREVRDTLAADIATQFGITAKAVRDIWNLRTWLRGCLRCFGWDVFCAHQRGHWMQHWSASLPLDA